MNTSQVLPVPFGQALKISLDNYYDLLKAQVGGLGSQEFLQLKLVADPVDISAEKYRYWSHYNLVRRSDLAIEPKPVSGSILTGAEELWRVYGKFLQRLRKYAVMKDLTANEQQELADLDMLILRKTDLRDEIFFNQHQKWLQYCEATGQNPADQAFYLQWRGNRPDTRRMEDLSDEIKKHLFRKKTITDRQYSDQDDAEIVKAENDFLNPLMRLRYPMWPDYSYQTPLTLEYLANLPLGSTSLFDDRRTFTWNLDLNTMVTTGAGAFNATFDRTTTTSESIKTDWSYSGSGGWAFIKVKASASEHRSITEEFKKGTTIKLGAKSAFKVRIVYPGWFQPHLFKSKRITENLRDFEEFFGEDGSLRYYPTELILVRGFKASFESTQRWTYDYVRKFSASGGGGFSAFGVNFGSSANYGSHSEEHKVDVSNTNLSFEDGDSTIRFVGYVVKQNTVWRPFVSPIDEPGPDARALQ